MRTVEPERSDAGKALAFSADREKRSQAARVLASGPSETKSRSALERMERVPMPPRPVHTARPLESLRCTCGADRRVHTDARDPRQTVINVEETLAPFAHTTTCPRGRAERRRKDLTPTCNKK